MDYVNFIKELDKKLEEYFDRQKEYICCEIGCSDCCEKGDYPISQTEYEYMIKGYTQIDDNLKREVQRNIRNMKRGGKCPFLVEKSCSVYSWRPIICRVHGLAYLYKEDTVKIPYCANNGKNFHSVYKNGEIEINPIKENLDTLYIIKNYEHGEFKNLYDWIKS